jgi:hypothetical protein
MLRGKVMRSQSVNVLPNINLPLETKRFINNQINCCGTDNSTSSAYKTNCEARSFDFHFNKYLHSPALVQLVRFLSLSITTRNGDSATHPRQIFDEMRVFGEMLVILWMPVDDREIPKETGARRIMKNVWLVFGSPSQTLDSCV